MMGPAFMANEPLSARFGYRWRSSRAGQAHYRLTRWIAARKLDLAERLLVDAVIEIDRHAIVSNQAASLYRAFEAYCAKRGR
jgi:hypothetical protein